jgi:hypothetical protein
LESESTTDLESGLDFLLGHFKEPIWPRKISTAVTEGKQVLASSKTDAISSFKRANLLDCRINAYRWREDWAIKLLGQPPEIIFVDEDERYFKSPRAFQISMRSTTRNFKEKLRGAFPTIIHSGRGFHFIQPVDGPILERYDVFAKLCEDPSDKFHRFAERFLTSYKSDPTHNPTFLSCMLRVPGSISSKNMAQVRIIQKWDGIRPAINWILRDYRRYLIREKFDEVLTSRKLNGYHSDNTYQSSKISWIESLLQTPIADHRKYALWRILAPYLINIKRLPYDEAFKILSAWLEKCGKARPLDFNSKDRIKANLGAAQRIGYLPIGFEKLKKENKEVYTRLALTK